MYLNRLTLIGFIGADAETKVGSSEQKFAVFSVATKRSWKNADGGWRQLPETRLYGEYGLVNVIPLVPSIAPRKRESS
jgi:hypothetical protein